MPTVKEIYKYLETKIPVSMAYDWDNCGVMVGFMDTEVERVLIALDITGWVIDEAERIGAKLIIAHHPLVFSGIKSVTDETVTGRSILKLAQYGISAISMHTNMDAAPGGLNDALIAAVGAECTGLLDPVGVGGDGKPYGHGRLGVMPRDYGFEEFLQLVCKSLNSAGLRYWNAGRDVRSIAVIGGSGGDFIGKAIDKGCDTFISADIKNNQLLEAREKGINLIDADHFCTENVCVPIFQEIMRDGFPELDVVISKTHSQTAMFFIR